MTKVKEKPAPCPVAERIPVLLLDTGTDWGMPQKQALALAMALNTQGYAPCVLCPPGSALALNAAEAELPIRRLQGKGLRSLLGLWLAQKRARPLCIHTFAEACLPLVARLLRLRRPESTVVLHSSFALPQEAVPPPLWAIVNKVVCTSAVLRGQLAEAAVEPAHLAVVHPSVQADYLPPRCPRHDGRFVFLALEPLQAQSGIDVLLKAMAALWQRVDLQPWEVRVVGDGPLFAELLAEAEALGVASRLALLGKQTLEEVLPQADVFIAPSTAAQGNVPSIMAAWRVDLPLICSNVAGHTEILNAGPCGVSGGKALHITAGDPQALASAMITVMNDPCLREQLAAQGQKMHTYVTIERVTEQYLPLYQDCVARRGWIVPPPTNQISSQASTVVSA